jgi:hypothetical protein
MKRRRPQLVLYPSSSHLQRLKQLEAENARLKRLVAEQMLATEAFKEVQEGRR